jgi:hypothetical protein
MYIYASYLSMCPCISFTHCLHNVHLLLFLFTPTCSAGVLRLLDLSGNAFSGAFPTSLISQAEAAQAACANMCSVRVLLNGSDMALACPGEMAVTQEQLGFLQQEDYTCRDGSGQQVWLVYGRVIWLSVVFCVGLRGFSKLCWQLAAAAAAAAAAAEPC